MPFDEFWKNLTDKERREFCKKIGLSFDFVRNRLVYRYRRPSLKALHAMVIYSDGKLSHQGLVKFFLTTKGKNTLSLLKSGGNA